MNPTCCECGVESQEKYPGLGGRWAYCGTHKSYACNECWQKSRFCCAKATVTPCVCTLSYDCPDHGRTHCGTHE